jgi:hypothetical protein
VTMTGKTAGTVTLLAIYMGDSNNLGRALAKGLRIR